MSDGANPPFYHSNSIAKFATTETCTMSGKHPTSTTAIISLAPNDGVVQWRKVGVNIRDPADDEVLVRIIASGLCHTDVAVTLTPEGAPGFFPYPKVVGHEGAGIVERVGRSITHVKQGDKVLLSIDFCGQESCRGCADETPGYCGQFHARNLFSVPDVYRTEDDEAVGGLFFGQSSFSQLAIVKGTSALNVEGLVENDEELRLFAPMGCGYQTGAAAVTELANVRAQDAIAVSSRPKF